MAIKTAAPSFLPEKQALLDKILGIAQEEKRKGNKSITQENLAALERHVLEKRRLGSTKAKQAGPKSTPEVPKPLVCPLFEKYHLPVQSSSPSLKRTRRKINLGSKYSFKRLEYIFIQVLEMLANLLDNLHLFLKLPGFPEGLVKMLLHTNKLWVLILVFLVRKTVLQLLNVIRKERKVNVELSILSQNNNSKVLLNAESQDPSNIYRKYEKVLKDLRFDKSMLVLELIGNFMDLAFNIIELGGVPVPDWLMSTLNFASMAMTIYRMNKDDEYIDDDITEDLI